MLRGCPRGSAPRVWCGGAGMAALRRRRSRGKRIVRGWLGRWVRAISFQGCPLGYDEYEHRSARHEFHTFLSFVDANHVPALFTPSCLLDRLTTFIPVFGPPQFPSFKSSDSNPASVRATESTKENQKLNRDNICKPR